MTKLYMRYEFNLPDDEYDYETLNKAKEYRDVLSGFFQELRTMAKHCEPDDGSYSEVYDMLWNYMRANNLSWEDVE